MRELQLRFERWYFVMDIQKKNSRMGVAFGSDALEGYEEAVELVRKEYPQLVAETGRLRTHAWEIDHLIPVSKGGTTTADNLRSLCHSCHKRKTKRERKLK